MWRGTSWKAALARCVTATATGVTWLLPAWPLVAAAQPGEAQATSAPSGQPPPAPAPAPLVQPGRVTLVYVRGKGAEPCDDEKTFRAWLAGELGADPFVKAPAPATARLEVARETGGFRATLVLEEPAGTERTRHSRAGRDCNDALDRLAIDVVLDLFRPPPRSAVPAPSPGPAPVPGGPAPDCDPCTLREELAALRRKQEEQGHELTRLRRELSRARVAVEDERRDAEEKRRALESRLNALKASYPERMDVTFALSAGALLTLGVTNNAGMGFVVGGEVHSGILALGVEARGTLPSEFGPKLLGDDVNDYSRLQGALVPCVRYWYLFGCGVLTVGAQVAQSSIYAPNTSFDWIWEVGPRLGAEIPLGDVLAGRAWGEVLFNPYPTNYGGDVDGVAVSEKQISAAAGFVGAGLVVHFGK